MIKQYLSDIRKLVRPTLNIFLLYFLISVLSGRYGALFGICACLPFTFPVLIDKEAPALHLFAMSFISGALGIALSVTLMLVFSSYGTSLWLFPAAFGAVLCAAYLFFTKNKSVTAKTFSKQAVLMTAALVCFFQST